MSSKPIGKIIFGDCQNMKELDDNSVHLVVTSPHISMHLLTIPTYLRATRNS